MESNDSNPRVRTGLAVTHAPADQATDATRNLARSGRERAGNVLVYSPAEAVRTRTGETGPTAV